MVDADRDASTGFVALDDRGKFDLILVHGTLHLFPPTAGLMPLTRIDRALRPGGRGCVPSTPASRSTVGIDDNFHSGYANTVLDELKRLRIALPDNEETIGEQFSANFTPASVAGGLLAAPADAELLLKTGRLHACPLHASGRQACRRRAELCVSHFETSLHAYCQMTIERNLVLVHTPGYQDVADFQVIAGKVQELAPDIEVYIASNNISSSVTRRLRQTTGRGFGAPASC